MIMTGCCGAVTVVTGDVPAAKAVNGDARKTTSNAEKQIFCCCLIGNLLGRTAEKMNTSMLASTVCVRLDYNRGIVDFRSNDDRTADVRILDNNIGNASGQCGWI